MTATFADLLKDTQPVTIGSLIERAYYAAEKVSSGYRNDLSDYEMMRLEDARIDAVVAVKDALFSVGVTDRQLKMLSEIV